MDIICVFFGHQLMSSNCYITRNFVVHLEVFKLFNDYNTNLRSIFANIENAYKRQNPANLVICRAANFSGSIIRPSIRYFSSLQRRKRDSNLKPAARLYTAFLIFFFCCTMVPVPLINFLNQEEVQNLEFPVLLI